MQSLFEGEVDDEFVPGKYAEDAKVLLLIGSFGVWVASMLAFAFDGWESATFFLLMAIWLVLMYVALERR